MSLLKGVIGIWSFYPMKNSYLSNALVLWKVSF